MSSNPADIHSSIERVSSVGGNQSNADIQYFIQGPDLQKFADFADKLVAKAHNAALSSGQHAPPGKPKSASKSTVRAPPI